MHQSKHLHSVVSILLAHGILLFAASLGVLVGDPYYAQCTV